MTTSRIRWNLSPRGRHRWARRRRCGLPGFRPEGWRRLQGWRERRRGGCPRRRGGFRRPSAFSPSAMAARAWAKGSLAGSASSYMRWLAAAIGGVAGTAAQVAGQRVVDAGWRGLGRCGTGRTSTSRSPAYRNRTGSRGTDHRLLYRAGCRPLSGARPSGLGSRPGSRRSGCRR